MRLYYSTVQLLFQSWDQFYLTNKNVFTQAKTLQKTPTVNILKSEFRSCYISQKRYNHVSACNKHLLIKYKSYVKLGWGKGDRLPLETGVPPLSPLWEKLKFGKILKLSHKNAIKLKNKAPPWNFSKIDPPELRPDLMYANVYVYKNAHLEKNKDFLFFACINLILYSFCTFILFTVVMLCHSCYFNNKERGNKLRPEWQVI